jgi:hypothetical protein
MVSLEARLAQDGVRQFSCMVDDAVGVAVRGGAILAQGTVGVQALRAETVVRLRTVAYVSSLGQSELTVPRAPLSVKTPPICPPVRADHRTLETRPALDALHFYTSAA